MGRSLWRISANFSSPSSPSISPASAALETQSFLDILALKLRSGDERVLTIPLGEHAIVLRLLPTTLRVDVPRPVFGLFLPPAEAADELRLHSSSQGEVAGIFVHSLAVHSPHVRQGYRVTCGLWMYVIMWMSNMLPYLAESCRNEFAMGKQTCGHCSSLTCSGQEVSKIYNGIEWI